MISGVVIVPVAKIQRDGLGAAEQRSRPFSEDSRGLHGLFLREGSACLEVTDFRDKREETLTLRFLTEERSF